MIRRLALLVSAVAIAPLFTVAQADAYPICLAGYQCSRTFYADSTNSQVVGGWVKFCDGTTDSWGTVTHYVSTSQVPCG
ncbi:hypothetical protein EV186_105223 [Labedaea rhizosphaerae]|uniref:Peptidase inhibitor family I36 n=2 Tax=Labedaea rhizosphaerae TaxID=598644 RepID=A0A4R6S5Q7_LABRH|nr:hypothetical protein EV186_105223 [Labedaea rhizosphaerae]